MAEENNNDWRTGLPLEYRTSDSLAKFKDLGSLAKSYLDMERYVGSTGRVPGQDAKPEEWATYHKHWGRPEKPEEYKAPDDPYVKNMDEQFTGSVRKLAHDLGLNQKQYTQMMLWGVEQTKGLEAINAQLLGTATKELENEWGFRFKDNTDRAHKTIAMLVDYKADHPFVKWLESTGNDNNPTVLRFFHDLSKRLGEDNFVTQQQKTQVSEQQEAQKKINEIMGDNKHPYFHGEMPGHKDAVAEVSRLYSIITPE